MIRLRFLFFLAVVLIFALQGCDSSEKPAEKSLPEEKLVVGVYNGNGASAICVIETLEALKMDQGIVSQEISPTDIQKYGLSDFDVLIFPGGSGSKEFNSLGQKNAELVRDFAATKGKGIVGICAGGYLFASTEGYPSLKILRAKTIRDHYNRGRGLVGIEITEEGRTIFPELADFDTVFVQYYDGPIYRILDSSKLSVYATITSDIATHKQDPHGITPGKPAFLTAPWGDGKVFVSVGHPESTPGMRWMVPRMARWVCNRELISYSENLVNPDINDHEILYSPELIKFEKDYFWELFNGDDKIVTDAIDRLYSIRSRPSIRWSTGLLRHNSQEVRHKAADYLLETEYTHAIPDLESAWLSENDPALKTHLQEVLNSLKSYVHVKKTD